MSDKRMFEFVDGGSSKFWEVWRTGNEVRTRYGRIGSDGQTTVKDEGSEAAAEKLYNKLVKEKTGKGYVEKTDGAAPAPAPVVAAPVSKPVAAPKPAAAPKAAAKKAAVVEDDEDEEEDEGEGGSAGEARYEVDEKFWAISLDGSSHTVRYGKIGTAGTSKTKDFDDEAAAKKDHDKLVKEKTGKGYELVSAEDADDEEDEEDESEEDESEEDDSDEDDSDEDDSDEDDSDEDEDEDDDGEGWRRFEMDGKFWAIQLDGASHTVKYGKIGNDGTEKTKDFDDEKSAEADAEKLIEEKTSKGYEEIE